ncbi:MAG: response regulator [Actinomycetota bacterium]|nr:response regulator [Actinomycetota bacterium]
MPSARVLIVEDHPTMREAMRMVLEGEGFDVSEATDGRSALEAVRAQLPDLILLDLNMPGPGGADVLSEIKSDPANVSVRVIVVTAAGEEGREDALSLGADGYFTKPFNPAALVKTVAGLLSDPPDNA